MKITTILTTGALAVTVAFSSGARAADDAQTAKAKTEEKTGADAENAGHEAKKQGSELRRKARDQKRAGKRHEGAANESPVGSGCAVK